MYELLRDIIAQIAMQLINKISTQHCMILAVRFVLYLFCWVIELAAQYSLAFSDFMLLFAVFFSSQRA